ncbi:hypothetical protein QBC32DRAFT_348995 [Pseudoneurospora amorphoporcata]|uniref:Heterokaryon incompatibility domain-containing protein n=1 Tax=Pseudoneurospora amorphoporcata TaxID=241081 RepID=A0AAN6NR12_9PEZI|nr:hypothetical protein QBC32DRAFT_348995 [Pseudoneurospora amorphoporcata]
MTTYHVAIFACFNYCRLKTRTPQYTVSSFCTALDSNVTRPYEALSYVWGSGDKPRSIFMNGYNLAVGENLYAALLHLPRSLHSTDYMDRCHLH